MEKEILATTYLGTQSIDSKDYFRYEVLVSTPLDLTDKFSVVEETVDLLEEPIVEEVVEQKKSFWSKILR